MNIELIYATLFKIIEERENIEIEYTIERRLEDGVYVREESEQGM